MKNDVKCGTTKSGENHIMGFKYLKKNIAIHMTETVLISLKNADDQKKTMQPIEKSEEEEEM